MLCGFSFLYVSTIGEALKRKLVVWPLFSAREFMVSLGAFLKESTRRYRRFVIIEKDQIDFLVKTEKTFSI